jgi:multidrug efflux pump subunit AcrA (membrane-fusion protein)
MKQFAVIAAIILLAMPTPAKACSGLFDCMFGWTDREEVRSAAQTEQARIDAQAAAEVARIEAEQAERVRQADAEVERVKQQQYATNAQRDIAIAQIEQQAAQYKASIAALTAERLGRDSSQRRQSDQAATVPGGNCIQPALQKPAVTERYRIVGGWAFAIVAIVLVGLLVGVVRPSNADAHRQPSGGHGDGAPTHAVALDG